MKKLLFMMAVLITYSICGQTVQIEKIGLFLKTDPQQPQWIEIKNDSDLEIDISNWKLFIEKEEIYSFPVDTILSSKESILIYFICSKDKNLLNNNHIVFRNDPILSGKLFEDNTEFIKRYELFRTYESEEERRKTYERWLPALENTKIILERLYLKNSSGQIEDKVLITDIYINNIRDFKLANLSKAGLMPIKILVKEGMDFINRQAIEIPKVYQVKSLELGNQFITLNIDPFYLLAEKNAMVELQLFEDEKMEKNCLNTSGPIRTSTCLMISTEEDQILRALKTNKIYFKMRIKADHYQSNEMVGDALFIIYEEDD